MEDDPCDDESPHAFLLSDVWASMSTVFSGSAAVCGAASKLGDRNGKRWLAEANSCVLAVASSVTFGSKESERVGVVAVSASA